MSDKIEFEIGRFFLALKKSLIKPQLLPYLRDQILSDVELNYIHTTDDEVKTYLAGKKS